MKEQYGKQSQINKDRDLSVGAGIAVLKHTEKQRISLSGIFPVMLMSRNESSDPTKLSDLTCIMDFFHERAVWLLFPIYTQHAGVLFNITSHQKFEKRCYVQISHICTLALEQIQNDSTIQQQ